VSLFSGPMRGESSLRVRPQGAPGQACDRHGSGRQAW
jgi:hypothetical protein